MNPFDKYPYSDMHELNLDWILKKMKEALEQVASGEASIQEALTTVQQYNERLQQYNERLQQVEAKSAEFEYQIRSLGGQLEHLSGVVDESAEDITEIQRTIGNIEITISVLQQAVANMAVTRHLEYREGHFIENDTIRDFEDITEYILRGYNIDVALTDGTHLRLADYIPTRITFNGVVTDTVSPYVYTLTINVSDNITDKTIPIAPDMTIYYYPSSDPEGHPEWEYMIYEGTRVNNAEAIAISSRNPDIVILDTSTGYIYHQSIRISVDEYVFINPLENGVGIFILGSSYIDVSYNNFASVAQVLTKQNTTPFTPTEDYQPATKKYVDEHAGGGEWELKGTIIDSIINVDLSGCTELLIDGSVTATGNSSLIINRQHSLVSNLATSGSKTYVGYCKTINGLIMPLSGKSGTGSIIYPTLLYPNIIRVNISEITTIGFADWSLITECNLKIYGR